MTPTAHGRLCSQCAKEIYDFSGMSWQEIEQTQQAHGNALCGMYTPAQLRHWGQQPLPTCAPLAAATALALTLSNLPAWGQTLPITTDSIRIWGTVTVQFDPEGQPQPAPGAGIVVAGTSLGTTTDPAGRYELIIPASTAAVADIAIQYHSVGFKGSFFTVPAATVGTVQHDALLMSAPAIVYAVQRPSLLNRFTWRLRHLFSSYQ